MLFGHALLDSLESLLAFSLEAIRSGAYKVHAASETVSYILKSCTSKLQERLQEHLDVRRTMREGIATELIWRSQSLVEEGADGNNLLSRLVSAYEAQLITVDELRDHSVAPCHTWSGFWSRKMSCHFAISH